MAGQQSDKFLTGLDQDLLNFVWLDDLDFGHPILERFPKVRNDDLVAGLDVAEDSRQLQRVGAVVYAEGILRTHECGEILLELFKIFAI